MRRIGQNWNNTIFASASWKNLKLTYNGQITSDSKSWGLSSGTLGNFTNAYNMLSPVGYHNIALRYDAPFGLTAGGDYTCYSENRSQSLFKDTDYLLGSENRQDINRWHVYIDRQRQLGKWQLNYGAEYQHSEDHSSQHYYPYDNPDFDDILSEDVASLYVGTLRSFDLGLSFNVSAKGNIITINISTTGILSLSLGQHIIRRPKAYFSLTSTPGASIRHIGNCMEAQAISMIILPLSEIRSCSPIFSMMPNSTTFLVRNMSLRSISSMAIKPLRYGCHTSRPMLSTLFIRQST